jgi:hypothetical protein
VGSEYGEREQKREKEKVKERRGAGGTRVVSLSLKDLAKQDIEKYRSRSVNRQEEEKKRIRDSMGFHEEDPIVR